MTQHEMIINYIEENGSISPMEAFRDLGITKLATRIGELAHAGVIFDKSYEVSNNRYGKPCRYMRYWLAQQGGD